MRSIGFFSDSYSRAEPALIRQARKSDLPGIQRLLRQEGLPADDLGDHLDTFLVAEIGDGLAGVIGIEVYSPGALLRSLVVSPDYRRRGLATALCDRVEAEAVRLGLSEIFLLTETAQAYFSRRGYSVAARAEAPAEIASTAEFSSICPETAVFMRRRI